VRDTANQPDTARQQDPRYAASLGCIARQKSDVTYLCVRDIRQAVAPCSDFTHPSYGLRGARFALSSAICFILFTVIRCDEQDILFVNLQI